MKNRIFNFQFSISNYVLGLLLMMGASTTAYGQVVKGKIFGGGQMAQVNGVGDEAACRVTIKSGDAYGKVYGAGEGVKSDASGYTPEQRPDVAKVTGFVEVNFQKDGTGTTWKDVFGGGAMAKVEGDTYVNMDGGHIAANMFGGGEGDITGSTITSADVTNDTHVLVTGGDVIWNRTSLTKSKSSNITTYTYTKDVPEETVSNATVKMAKLDEPLLLSDLAANGYTNITVSGYTGNEEDGYTYTVSYKIPAHTLTKTYVGSKPADDAELQDDGYVLHEETESRDLQDGDIVYWDTTNRTPDYYNDSDPNHKIHNELFYDETNKKFLIKHNIFGGGYIASKVSGTANVNVERGLVDYNLIGTSQWKECFEDTKDPHFYVFGGGYGAYTSVAETKVNVKVAGKYDDWNAEVDKNLAKGGSGFFDDNEAPADPDTDDKGNMGIYDNKYGIPSFTILGVLGGGLGGIVTGNTDVTVGGDTFISHVYGGGFGSKDEYAKLTELDKIYSVIDNSDPSNPVETASYTREDLGMVLGNTNVVTTGASIYGDVFGGGAGIESIIGTGAKDFVRMAKVHGYTRVNVGYESRIYGTVYGGGDIANVANTAEDKNATIVTIKGGNVWQDVFAGGNGRTNGQCVDYTSLGRINGNSKVVITDYTSTDEDVEKEYAESAGIDYSPNVWRNIYGGCAYGTVAGDTRVQVDGGSIGNDIFGGGFGLLASGAGHNTSADVTGNTTVIVNGGKYIWRQIADKNGNKKGINDREVLLADIKAVEDGSNPNALNDPLKDAKDIFDKDQNLFIGYDNALDPYRDHNIYGGGNTVSTIGTYSDETLTSGGKATVIINHGMLDETFVAPNSDKVYAYEDDAKWSLAGLCRYRIYGNTEHPQFAVLGGGYGYETKVGNTDVRIQIGKEQETYPQDATEEQKAEVDAINAYLADYDPTADQEAWKTFSETLRGEYNTVTDKDKNEKYGGMSGSNGVNRYITSRAALSFGVPNNSVLYVVGGGMAGKVANNTNVVISDNAQCYGVFGGGIGITPTVAMANQSEADDIDYGQVGGNAHVSIKNGIVKGDVFGGGAGIASLKVGSDNKVLADQTQSGEYRDFTNIARVCGTTQVDLDGTATQMIVYGRVFGGGDVANVGNPVITDGVIQSAAAVLPAVLNNPESGTPYTSQVNLYGGNVLRQVFAGGNGRKAAECADYTKVGAIFGNARVTLDHGKSTVDGSSLWLWNRVYGGGQNGTIYGNANVQIASGNLGYNVFGGGWGSVDTVNDIEQKTSADVKRNTNIHVTGGDWTLSQMWNDVTKTWAPVHEDKVNGIVYSSQYDPEANKFLINHNIYGGGNACSNVGGDTYITLAKGLLGGRAALGHDYDIDDAQAFFQSHEWTNVYNKLGSSHFCVYGGGYGAATSVGNTNVNVNIASGTGVHELIAGDSEKETDVLKADLSGVFYGGQSFMDIIGGGYQGVVREATHVDIDGNTYLRRAFGGSFYADITQTNVNIKSVNADDIFGGGLMGDIKKVTGTGIEDEDCGKVNLTIGVAGQPNDKIFINRNVYGGNDVSGAITNTITLNANGGKIYGNVYGAGNGNYLYAFTKDPNQMRVVANEEYIDANNGNKKIDEVVYVVPAINDKYAKLYHADKEDYFIENLGSVTSSQKIINIAQFRPKAVKAVLNLKGTSTTNRLRVLGNVFGGGNTATISSVNGVKPDVTVNIGSHIEFGGAFMGSDGNALFDDSNGFMSTFNSINNINLSDKLNWAADPELQAINENYIPVAKDERQKIYKSNLDLYFQPVEMAVQPTLQWNGTPEGAGLEDATIGTFVCGGNRGNMNVAPDAQGNIVDYIFPEGLTIVNRIVGGCNQANHTIVATNTKHEGGYLLGERTNGTKNYTKPAINLLVKCQFKKPDGAVADWKEGLNVYGGCYQSGTINGDVNIDFRSTMLSGMSEAAIKTLAKNAEKRAIGNVYGAGYGKESFVYGNTNVSIGKAMGYAPSLAKSISPIGNKITTDPEPNPDAGSEAVVVMSAFGGGQEGNVIGNSFVHVLNGHVGKSVIGGSYAGNLWGSTHVLVGYPKYYKAKETGIFKLDRTDKWNTAEENFDHSKVIKQQIFVLKDDYISQDVYDAITGIKNSGDSYTDLDNTAKTAKFDEVTTTPTIGGYNADWSNIDIKVEEAVYGGGYSVLNGAGGSGNYTVRKFEEAQNMDGSYTAQQLGEEFASNGSTSKGYGGNTTVLVWDQPTVESTTDHIVISKQDMQEVVLPEGTDLFNYYYIDAQNNYRYIYQEGEFAYGTKMPDDVHTTYQRKVYEYDGEGGLYGDGHFSFAEGFRAGDVKGYGFATSKPNGAKILNTLQRMDMIRMTDCCMVLLGARDYTVNEISTTPYSISRVGEIYMVAENVKTSTEAEKEGHLAGLTIPKSRNYLGLSNNLHYVGAIKSNVAMTDQMYDTDGAPVNDYTYRSKKQWYIDTHKANFAEFQKRNAATAKNMIGISSGYALKIQNVKTTQTTIDDKTVKGEEIFYGPIVGVVEMQLLNVRQSEAGGYVYADNIHHRASPDDGSTVPAEYGSNEDFLETSGNFVFPYNGQRAQYIVDDCFNNGWDEYHNANGVPEDGVHYWYVTGTNYYFNAHITGYTSTTKGLSFAVDNSDGILRLSGTQAGAKVTLKSIKWRSNHRINPEDGTEVDYDCDLQDRNTYNGAAPAPTDASGTPVVGGYNLRIGSGSSENVRLSDDTGVGVKYTKDSYQVADHSETNEYAMLFAPDGDVVKYERLLPGVTVGNEDNILIEVNDNVDNSTTAYFNNYLEKPCQATIVLTSPLLAEDGHGNKIPKKGYIDTSDFFTKDDVGDGYTQVTKDVVITLPATLASGSTYYYKYNDQYLPLSADMVATYDEELQKYVPLDVTTVTAGNENRYGIMTELVNVYNIYLTIRYIQGPNVTGNIEINNCALPGEYIRVTPGNVKVEADVSMAQNGTIWRIGKVEGDHLADGYYTFHQQTEKANDDMLKDVKVVPSILGEGKSDILVPAYYFMNGYGVQYCYTVASIDDQVFETPFLESNVLTVHNYHRMLPRQNGSALTDFDLHLDLAAQRAAGGELPEPRIYIYDEKDLNAFGNMVNAKAEPSAAVGSKTDFGKNMQFFIMRNITAAAGSNQAGNVIAKYQDVQPTNFNGTLHGMGHVISGIPQDGSLMKALSAEDNEGNIYNLGLQSGVITAGDAGADNAKYHCNYTWQNKTVYRMDGTAVNAYTDDDWRYGKVTYDLNQYYLEARKTSLASDPRDPSEVPTYVESLYHNGDYLYAYRYNETTQPEYLRTNNDEDANYLADNVMTWHNAEHPIDESRAVMRAVTPPTPSKSVGIIDTPVGSGVMGNAKAAGGINTVTDDPEPEKVFDHYAPLYEAAWADETYNTLTAKKDDYIFFGQTLDADTKDADLGTVAKTLPTVIAGGASHTLNQFTNRLFRAGGYYASKDSDDKRYENTEHTYYYNSEAYAHDNGISAIDFHGYPESTTTWYAPVIDSGLAEFSRADGVTQNLLVYTEAADQATTIFKDYRYNEDTKEQKILMHIINPIDPAPEEPATVRATANAGLFHLVERTAKNENAEGDPCTNNDFEAPIAFNVNTRAWYTRQPAYYAESYNDAWEGICLPFTATKTTASLNGEITHFYGTPTEAQLNAPETNDKTLHHEYWLRGLTDVVDGTGTQLGKKVGAFQRPGQGLFYPADPSDPSNPSATSLASMDYTYNNTWFKDTYKDYNYNWDDASDQNKWYSESHTFANYHPLTADIPYIVSFPGIRYYEFDLSSQFYNSVMPESKKQGAQTVTFNAYGSAYVPDPDENVNRADGPILVKATTEMKSSAAQSTKTYNHVGTYLSKSDAAVCGINATGTAFDKDVDNVLPFRTYMTIDVASSAKAVYIGGGITEIINVDPQNPAEELTGDHLTVFPGKHQCISVESTYSTSLKIYTAAGQLYRVIDVRPGTYTYSGIAPGIYIANGRKVRVQ